MPDLIAQQPDVIIVWAANGKAIVPAIKQAHDAGIPVVTINAQIDPSGQNYIVAHAGPNDYNQGDSSRRDVDQGHGREGQHRRDPRHHRLRPRRPARPGLRRHRQEYPNVKLLDVQAGNWSQGQGQSIMENFITRFGKQIDGVLSSDGYSGTGAYLAVQAAAQPASSTPITSSSSIPTSSPRTMT